MLSDEQWRLVQPLFPAPPATLRRGRPSIPTRLVLEAVLWKLAARAPWRSLPMRGVSYQVCYQYYRRWRDSGLLARVIHLLLRDLDQRLHFDPATVVRQGRVRFERIGDAMVCFVAGDLAVSPHLGVAMLYFQRIAAITERNAGLAQFPDPLLEVFDAAARLKK